MSNLLKFRQYIEGEYFYWGYGVNPDPAEFVPPKEPAAPSERFTGVLDQRKGIKIYENDIVIVHHRKHGKDRAEVRQVVWNGAGFNLSGGAFADYELIGNIHEDKDLLDESV